MGDLRRVEQATSYNRTSIRATQPLNYEKRLQNPFN